MGMALGGKAGPKHDINITPYIDILLVLLIIFMVITPVHQMDLDVKVPQPPPPDRRERSAWCGRTGRRSCWKPARVR